MKKFWRLVPFAMGIVLSAGCAGGGNTAANGGEQGGKEPAGTTAGASENSVSEEKLPPGPLAIAVKDADGIPNPVFSVTDADRTAAKLVNVRLMENDRLGRVIYKGKAGEKHKYGETEYEYSGLADCSVDVLEDGSAVYTFDLRDDVKFSDGEALSADDLLFTCYVLCDPSYDGESEFASLPISGKEAYVGGSRSLMDLMLQKGENNSDFTWYDEAAQKDFFEKDLPAAGEAFADSIAAYCTESGFTTGIEKIDSCDMALAMANWGYAYINNDETLNSTYSGKHWSLEGSEKPTAADFFNEMMLAYNKNVKRISDAENAGVMIEDLLPEKYKNAVMTADAPVSINGIKKENDHCISVKLDKYDASYIYRMNTYILPLHYYGDESLFDPENGSYGFVKGDLEDIRAKETSPVGAGPFVYDHSEGDEMYFTANPSYFRGQPAAEELILKSVSENALVEAMADGSIDISYKTEDKAFAEKAAEQTDAMGVVFTDTTGYGYIGMNAGRVKVGYDAYSEESKYLRKAIATVLGAYRDESVEKYYGPLARTARHPVSDISAMTEDAEDTLLKKDVYGRDIYSDSMNEEQRSAAAIAAALGYFEKAGYTVQNGKLTAAPEGGKLAYELMIPGHGEGDHPSMEMVKKAALKLADIGFELKINDLSDTYVLWTALEGGQADMWCAAWQSGIYPDMSGIYHSEGRSAYIYRLFNKDLDMKINEANGAIGEEKNAAALKTALDTLEDLMIEIPVYRRRECFAYSAERIDAANIPADQTAFYDYMDEIEKIR